MIPMQRWENCWLFSTSQGGAGELSGGHRILHCHGRAVIKMSVYLRISWNKQQNNYFYLNLDPECKSVQCSVWWKWSVAKALLLSLRLKETHCVTVWVVSRASCPLLRFSPENITTDCCYPDLSIWQNINAVNLSLKGKDWQYCSQWKNLNFKTKIRIAENLYLSLWHASQHSKSFLKRSLSSIQSLSCARLFATPWTAAHQAPLSTTNSQSLLKFMSIESVTPSNHLILSSPSPGFNLSQHQGLFQWVSSLHQVAKGLELQLQHQSFQWIFRTDLIQDGLVGSPCYPRDSQESSPIPQFKSINSSVLCFLYSPTLISIHDYWENHGFD